MPNDWTGNSKTERGFFWDILTSLAPEYVEALIKDCRQQRIGAAAARNLQPRQLNVAPDWAQALLAQPFISSMYLLLITRLTLPLYFPFTDARAGNQSVLI